MMTLNHTQRLAGFSGTKSPITRAYDAYLNGLGDTTPSLFDTHPLIITSIAAVLAFGVGWISARHIAG